MVQSDVILQKPFTDFEALNDVIIDAIQDIKGKKIVKLNLKKLGDAPTDYFIVCQGESTVQVRAIAENISKRVKEAFDFKPSHLEGILGSKWVLVDYLNTIVHVFYPETRDFYNIEDLWNDGAITTYDDV